jgi:hypothetical protein
VKDRLFVLRPGFEDGGVRWFCPYSAQVIGFLAYYPEVRATIELYELGFARPRRPLSELLGEANQAPPMLVLNGAPAREVAEVDVGQANGLWFVGRTLHILRYLAATRGLPAPH